MRRPPAALTLESKGARDHGLMSPAILEQLSAILMTDIAIHHREFIGEATKNVSTHTIQQVEVMGETQHWPPILHPKPTVTLSRVCMKKATFMNPFRI